MLDWLAAQTHTKPDGIALIAGDQVWTYHALNDAVGQMAGALRANGIARSDLVAALLPNSADYVILVHALARLGGVLIPVNTRLTAAELTYQIQMTQARRIIVCAETSKAAAPLAASSPLLDVQSLRSSTPNPPAPIPEGDIALEAVQAIVFTSGTTGQPKGASITFGNQFWSAMGSAYRLGTLPDDRWLCCLSLFHIGGLAILMRCCLYGTTVVLQQGFQIKSVTRAISDQHVTLISLVPTMVHRMLKLPEAVRALQRVRLVLIGGAASSPDLLKDCAALNIPASPTYGLSEACSQVATLLPDDARRKPGCVGKPLLFNRIEILDEQGNAAAPGVYGEIVISGQTVMAGYANNPAATAQTLRDGKLYTGDIGYLDADGDLWPVQRRSDLIVSGGENIYPAEVEQVLLRHPFVEAACVISLPNPEWGALVAAAVVLKSGASLTDADLLAFSRQFLAGYKQPRLIRFVDALPMTGSGKIERRAVIALLNTDAHVPD